jgi:transcriptional regulator with XRE-family HTH domain
VEVGAHGHGPGRHPRMEVDHYVSLRIRERRIMLGLTQQQMAALIGVTYQQAHKYETGINRISAGRLYQVAQALEVEVGHFFAGVDTGAGPKASRHQRVLLELARSFLAIPNRDHQAALCSLARTLAGIAVGVEQAAAAFD